MHLENGRLRLTLDERSGSIVGIEDRKTGLVHLNATGDGRADGRLLRVIVPSAVWSSRYADSHVGPPPQIEQRGTGVRLLFAGLQAQGEPTGITAEVQIDLPPGTDEARLTLYLRNDGPGQVTEIQFPWIGGWTGLGGTGKDLMILGAHSEFDPFSFPLNKGTTYAQYHQRTSFDYPLAMYEPWMDLSGPGGGLSYINTMRTPQNGFMALMNLAGHGHGPGLRLAWAWCAPILLQPGEEWTSPPFALSVHGGDWHETADRYRVWMDTWRAPAPGKRAARTAIGFQNVFLRGFDGAPFNDLDAIPAIAAAGRRYGVEQLCLWDHILLGNYCKAVDADLLEYPEAEKQAIVRGLAQARAEGTNVSALVNWRVCNSMSSLWRREAHAEAGRSLDGSLRQESPCASHYHGRIMTNHLGPNSYPLSAFAPTFRARVLRQTRAYLSWGFTSLFYDQPFEYLPDYGHLAEGKRPEDTYAAVVDLLSEVRALLRQNDPDGLLIGELCEGFASQYIDLWMSWYLKPAPALRSAYSIPHTMQSWVVDSNPGQASLAFAAGLYLCLCTHGNEGTLDDEPAFAQHVAALAALRKRAAERTVMARFADMRGLRVQGDDGLVAYSYDGDEGPAVIVAAPGSKGRITVELDRAAFGVPGDPDYGLIRRLDGRESEARGDRQTFVLGENEVAVWEA
jgi:hypothetical protein